MKQHPFVHLPATLHGVPFLAELNDLALEEVIKGSTLLEYDSGDEVVSEGAEGVAFYILLSGRMDVVKGGAKVGEIAGKGATIGELNLFDGAPRSATVVATEKSFCLRVARGALDELDERQMADYQAALYRFLAEVLVERLRATNERVAELEKRLEG